MTGLSPETRYLIKDYVIFECVCPFYNNYENPPLYRFQMSYRTFMKLVETNPSYILDGVNFPSSFGVVGLNDRSYSK